MLGFFDTAAFVLGEQGHRARGFRYGGVCFWRAWRGVNECSCRCRCRRAWPEAPCYRLTVTREQRAAARRASWSGGRVSASDQADMDRAFWLAATPAQRLEAVFEMQKQVWKRDNPNGPPLRLDRSIGGARSRLIAVAPRTRAETASTEAHDAATPSVMLGFFGTPASVSGGYAHRARGFRYGGVCSWRAWRAGARRARGTARST